MKTYCLRRRRVVKICAASLQELRRRDAPIRREECESYYDMSPPIRNAASGAARHYAIILSSIDAHAMRRLLLSREFTSFRRRGVPATATRRQERRSFILAYHGEIFRRRHFTERALRASAVCMPFSDAYHYESARRPVRMGRVIILRSASSTSDDHRRFIFRRCVRESLFHNTIHA